MSELPRIISTDDHVVEPPDLWTSRLPAKFQDKAPHVERHALAGVASLSATNMAKLARSAGATALAEDVLRVDPADAALRAIATDLTRAAEEIAAGRGSTAGTLVDKAAADLASVIRSGTEDAPRPETGPARRFGGAVADALKAQVKR